MSALVPIDPGLINVGPGVIRIAPLGSAIPTMAATGSTFASDAWDDAWLKVGPTTSGFQRSTSIETESITVEEDLEPVVTVITASSTSIAFTLVEDTIRTLKLAMAGGTTSTVSGSAATLSTKFAPPLLGAQNSVMVAWESDDQRFREIYYKCLQSGSVEPERRKGANPTAYSLSFTVQKPDPLVSVTSWNRWQAGAGIVV